MLVSTGQHVLRYTLMAVAILVIVGGGVYVGYFKSMRRRSSPHQQPMAPDHRQDENGEN